MNTTIHLRQYSPKDLAQTVRLWRASRRDAFPYVEVQQRYTLAEDMAYFQAIVVVECMVWLAEVEGHLAGLLAIKDDYIDQLFVAVELQRQGVGTALLQKARERPFELPGAIPVDHAHDALIAEQRFVQEALRACDGFVDAASDDVQIGRRAVARLQLHLDVDSSGPRRRPRAQHPQIADTRAHPLATDVEVRGAVVHRRHHPFEPEAADHDAVANRERHV